MRTLSYVVSSTIALSLVMVNPASSFAQAGQPDSNGISRRARFACAGAPCLLDGTLVVNAPFSAEVTTVWHPPAGSGRAVLQAASRLYRDSRGRVRVEQAGSAPRNCGAHTWRPSGRCQTPLRREMRIRASTPNA